MGPRRLKSPGSIEVPSLGGEPDASVREGPSRKVSFLNSAQSALDIPCISSLAASSFPRTATWDKCSHQN